VEENRDDVIPDRLHYPRDSIPDVLSEPPSEELTTELVPTAKELGFSGGSRYSS
jgi:hypothetical protein